MAQVFRELSFEITPNPQSDDARMTVLMVPHMKGIAGKISGVELETLISYLMGARETLRKKST